MNTRLHGLDALRGFALLLGIAFHGVLGFVAGFPWLVSDRFTSPAAAVFTFWAHSFRMPLFMLIAGYFARLSLERRGTAGFVRDRLKRILAPLLVFWPFVVPTLGLIVAPLWVARGTDLPQPPADPLLMASPGQLWFLWSLLQCYALALLVRAVGRRVAPHASRRLADAAGRLVSGPGAPVLAALTLFAALQAQGRPVGVEGPTTIRPEVPATLAFFGAFAIGWLLHAGPGSLERVKRGWGVRLGLAAVLTSACLWATGLDLEAQPSVAAPLLAAGYALAAWEWIYALLGASLTFLNTERPAIRYLADASYWMYLTHLPLVTLGAVAVADLGWPIPAKLLVILGIPTVLMLASYHLLVRSTRLGSWLNGRRHPLALPWRRPQPAAQPAG